MKRFIGINLIILVSILLFSCKNDDDNEEDDVTNKISYQEIYENKRLTKYDVVFGLGVYKSLYGYYLNLNQGYNSWFYKYDKTEQVSLLPIRDDVFKIDNSYFKNGEVFIEDDISLIREFVSPVEGNAKIYGNFFSLGKEQVDLDIYLNDELIFDVSIDGDDDEGVYVNIDKLLIVGDILRFQISGINSHSFFSPTVSFDLENNDSLYRLDSQGHYYGDMYLYYDFETKTLYDRYLWNPDARTQPYTHEFEKTSDFFNYELNISYDEQQKIMHNHYLNMMYDVQSYNDYSLYKDGIRDNFLYKEEDRMLLISQNVREMDGLQTDLTIRVSNDIHGLSWKPSKIVRSFENYQDGLPECPSIHKIGNRYYIFVSIAYQTVHQVGPLAYLIGDENVDLMDVDWQNKEFHYLDGEDLCASQVVEVGDKLYMFGWIPRTYYTMPWAPWGGYKNLPREVFQMADGTLGARLDPYLTRMLKQGSLYKNNNLNVNGFVTIHGSYNRTITELSVSMQNSTQFSIIYRQGNKDYKLSIVYEGNKTYMQVESPNDAYHTLNSRIEIARSDNYTLKIVNDGQFFEFFVNDEYALTAITAKTLDASTILFSSNDEAAVNEIKIFELSRFMDIHG